MFDYWTDDRMEKAQPVDPTVDPDFEKDQHSSRTPVSPPAEAPPSQESPAPADGESGGNEGAPSTQATKVTHFTKTAGRLFFDKGDGTGGWCTAAAVNSTSKRLIITAGHCVHSGRNGSWIKNAVFVPKYGKGNVRPHGMFQAKHFRTSSQWIARGGPVLDWGTAEAFANDVAFITLYDGNTSKKPVVNSVGGQGITYNRSDSWDASIFGYPSNKDNGETLYACWGTPFPDLAVANRAILGCPWGTGSSGGPWIQDYSNTTGLGYVRALTSTTVLNKEIAGVTFHSETRTMKDAANNDW